MKFLALVLLSSILIVRLAAAENLPGMTYQGRLTAAGVPASGVYDFTVAVFDSPTDPTNVLGGPQSITNVTVESGMFFLPLDFQPSVFTGAPRWLEIGVKTNRAQNYAKLSPRQLLSSSPYAITAGRVMAGGLPSGEYDAAFNFKNISNRISGVFSGDAANLTNLPLNGLSESAKQSIDQMAKDAAATATNSLTAQQLPDNGNAPSFTATSSTRTNIFNGPVSLRATERNPLGASLHILQPDYNGTLPLLIEGDYRNGVSGERYYSYFSPGNPALISNGYIVLDGGANSPPYHNPFMLAIFTDVPAGIEMVNHFEGTNAFHIEASGPKVNWTDSVFPVVFSFASRGQLSLINPYGSSYPVPQLVLTDSTVATNQSFGLRSASGVFSLSHYDSLTRSEFPVLSLAGGKVGIGTQSPGATLDIRGSAYVPRNIAPFSVTKGTTRVITNSNNRSQIVLQLAFGRRENSFASCRIISTNLVSTNLYVISPLAPNGSNVSITNLYTLPVQTNSVIVVQDTSAQPSFVSMLSYELFGH